MNLKTTINTSRWGASESRTTTGIQTIVVPQFANLKLLAPQKISITLYAVTPAPVPLIAAVSVRWIIGIGNGSMNHEENILVALTDIANQVPLVLERAASTIQVRAVITSTVPETHAIDLVALLAPSSPTWTQPLDCDEPERLDA
jgi:hypothetical protein